MAGLWWVFEVLIPQPVGCRFSQTSDSHGGILVLGSRTFQTCDRILNASFIK